MKTQRNRRVRNPQHPKRARDLLSTTDKVVTMRTKRLRLTLEAVTQLCHMALITPPEPDAHALVLQAKATQARAKLKRWEKARNRIPDYREMQANDDTKE